MKVLQLLFILCLVGCKNVYSPEFKHVLKINPVAIDHPKFEDMVKSLEYIPLETTDQSLVGEVTTLVVADNRFYINSDRKSILCFSEDGKFLFKIGNKGRGPGEYISPFSISVANGFVYVNCQESGKLLCYDASDGSFIRSLKLPKFYLQTVVSNGYIYGLDMTTKPFAIDAIRLDSPETIVELYSASEGEYVYSSFTQIFQSNEHCYWVDPMRGRVYELVDDKIKPFIDLDFGEYEFSDKILRNGEYRNDNTMVSGVTDFYHIGDIAILSLVGGDNDFHTLIINLESAKTINLGYMSYNGITIPEAYYQLPPRGIIAANKRFYKIIPSHYTDNYGDLPTEYTSYLRMKGMNPLEDNPTIIAYELDIH